MSNKRQRAKGTWLMTLGLLLLAAALVLLLYNQWDARRAGEKSEQVIEALDIPEEEADPDETPDYILNPDMDMPTKTVNGKKYIGKVNIPAIDRTLPVLADFNFDDLVIAPSRYTGSVYKDDMVIAGHNYISHFGHLKYLSIGDSVQFIDVEGNKFDYKVANMETLRPTDVMPMITGDWDLTLFTCTYGSWGRVAIRCGRVEKKPDEIKSNETKNNNRVGGGD